MDPYLCNEEDDTVHDTGQSSTQDAAVAAIGFLSLEETIVNDQDSMTDDMTSNNMKNEIASDSAVDMSTLTLPGERLVIKEDICCAESDECESSVSDGQVSADSVDFSAGKVSEESKDSQDIHLNIIIENQEDSVHDDMDPLIAVDDTESQSSDLINFDTVSYDVIQAPGGEGDDEKSLATLSSLSCDMIMDSPSKYSQASSSSSLLDLLDSSVKETSIMATCASPQIFVHDAVLELRSCPSSPSPHSSKSASSVVDESISEAFPSSLQTHDNIFASPDIPMETSVPMPKVTLDMDGQESKSTTSILVDNTTREIKCNETQSASCEIDSSSHQDSICPASTSEETNHTHLDRRKEADMSEKDTPFSEGVDVLKSKGDFKNCNEPSTVISDNDEERGVIDKGDSAKSEDLNIPEVLSNNPCEEQIVSQKFSALTDSQEEVGDISDGELMETVTKGVLLPDVQGNVCLVPPTSETQTAQEQQIPGRCIDAFNEESLLLETNQHDIDDSSISSASQGVDLSAQDLNIPEVLSNNPCEEQIVSQKFSALTDSQEEVGDISDGELMETVTKGVLLPDVQGNVCLVPPTSETQTAQEQQIPGRCIDAFNEESLLLETNQHDIDDSSISSASQGVDLSAHDLQKRDITVPISTLAVETPSLPVSPVSDNCTQSSIILEDNISMTSVTSCSDNIPVEENVLSVVASFGCSEMIMSGSPESSSHIPMSDVQIQKELPVSSTDITSYEETELSPLKAQMQPCSEETELSSEVVCNPQESEHHSDKRCSSGIPSQSDKTIEDSVMVDDNLLLSAEPKVLDIDLRDEVKSGVETIADSLKENAIENDVKDLKLATNLSDTSSPSGRFDTVQTILENVTGQSKRPTSLPNINPNNCANLKSKSMNFSEFLGLINAESCNTSTKGKQYSVTALDDAQQMASCLVADILSTAILKAEEKLTSSALMTANRVETVEAAHLLVDEVLRVASEQVSCSMEGTSEILSTCDIQDNRNNILIDHSAGQEVEIQCSGITSKSHDVSIDSGTECSTNQVVPDCVCEKSESPKLEDALDLPSDDHSQPVLESAYNESIPSSRKSRSEMDCKENDEYSLQNENLSVENSQSDSLVEIYSKEESGRNSISESCPTDSGRSSRISSSNLGLRSETSLFVDGVLEEAIKRYEESSSGDSSPVKPKCLALDPEFLDEEEEELATPCGEMLTEHFMDFESGRNVSVFCSIPENGSDDHLMAYDRIAHTIGNREVDSDNGKSVSVFRIEDDVYYEIQRASTCTSVFESVEEEDEDMIDTTIPLEDRLEKTMHTSASFPGCDGEKLNMISDSLKADSDAFEDAVGAFLSKEKVAQDERKFVLVERKKDKTESEGKAPEENTCRALVLRHPEYDLSNQEEKKRMAEKWANGGESEVPDTPEMREKQRAIREALDSDEDVAVKLCQLALTEGGLINDSLRREAWPRMLGLDPTLEVDAPSLEDLKSHPEYEQVVLDVNRSLKRFPPDIPKDRRETLQDKLTRLIMYVISKHPHLRYYQGYHDVAVTFLLVVGESVAFQIMERLSMEHLSDCMQPTFERTSYLLHFIYPLLHRLHPTLADYLERSEVGTMFCLPWFLTWFGHSLDRYQDVVRLYDHFLASPPLAPLYVAAVLVAHRADEVLAVDCDMPAIHALLSQIPDSLPLEILLRDATDLYQKFPPESIEREVEERFRNEQEMREMETKDRVRRQRSLRHRRGFSQDSNSWQVAEVHDRIGGTMMVLNRWMPPWVVQQQRLSMRLLFASATFFVGFYVYSRGGDMLL